MSFTQDLITSFRDYNDGDTRIGHLNRLWYDRGTNTIRVSDGVTPGGIIVSGGAGGAGSGDFDGGTPNSVYGGLTVFDFGGING